MAWQAVPRSYPLCANGLGGRTVKLPSTDRHVCSEIHHGGGQGWLSGKVGTPIIVDLFVQVRPHPPNDVSEATVRSAPRDKRGWLARDLLAARFPASVPVGLQPSLAWVVHEAVSECHQC